jgi:alpha-2-macroglobulin
VDGSTLAKDYVWTFRTLAPQITQLQATNNFSSYSMLLDSGFRALFSYGMDTTAAEAAFHVWLEPDDPHTDLREAGERVAVEGTFEWNEPYTRVTFKPNDFLLPGRTYVVEVDTTARTADGSAVLREPISETFYTVDKPFAYTETKEVRPGRRTIIFKFLTHMNKESFEDHVHIDPLPAGDIKISPQNSALAVTFDAEKDVDYTITLDAAIEDKYGYPLGKDAIFNIISREPPPPPPPPDGTYEFAPRFPIVILGTYAETLSLPMTVYGEATIHWKLYNFEPGMLDPYAPASDRWLERYGGENFTDGLQLLDFYSIPDPNDFYGTPTEIKPAWQTDDNLFYEWSQTLTIPEETSEVVQIPLKQPSGEALAPGIYGLQLVPSETTVGLTEPYTNWYGGGDRSSTILVISDVAITLRRSPLGALIFVSDLLTAQPAAGVTVKGYTVDGGVTLGTTNDDGVLQIEGKIPDYVTVEGDGHYGMWLDWSSQQAPEAESYLYTDRPIYRPGETVYFRGILRDQADIAYTVPDVKEIFVALQTWDTQNYEFVAIDSMVVSVNDFGTFSGSWNLPADGQLGEYNLILSSCDPLLPDCFRRDPEFYWIDYPLYHQSVSFQVAEFRVPEFEVAVEAARDEIISGETLAARVSSDYYFGSPVIDANVDVNVSFYYDYWARGFVYAGEERGYRFGNRFYWYYGEPDGEFKTMLGSGTTDDQGNYEFSETAQMTGSMPQYVYINATVTDESGQGISAMDKVLIHPSSVYIGLRPRKSFFTYTQAMPIDILTVGIDSAPVPNQSIELEIIEQRWKSTTDENGYVSWNIEEIKHGTDEVETGSDGEAVYAFRAPAQGEYYLKATTTDAEGRQAQTTIRVYALPANRTTHFGGNYFDEYYTCRYTTDARWLKLTADAEDYTPGDTAQIFIPNPFEDPVTAFITIERGKVIQYDMVEIDGSTYAYSLPITTEHAPNIYVEVLLIQPVSEEHPDPLYERGSIQLVVEPVAQRLNVEITPSSETAKPGETISIEVRVTDWQGNPVQAEVGVAVTDEAALAVAENTQPAMEDVFYDHQPNSVSNSTSLKLLFTNPIYETGGGCGGGGGGGGGGDAVLRDDFVYTPLWTTVVTDENGVGEVTVTLPDNLTRWRIDARAVTKDTLVGQATYNMTSTLPLIVRPAAPRFFVAGDTVPVAAVVHNNTDESQTVSITAEVDGIVLAEYAPIKMVLPPHGQTRVEWWGQVAADATGVDIIVAVRAESGLQDAARPVLRTSPDGKIPVYRYVAPDTVRTSGVLTEGGDVTEQILLPEQFSEVAATLDVTLQTSLASVTLDSLDYLRNYPYQCIEQTVSRFLPNVVTYRTLQDFNIANDTLESDLLTALDYSVTRLQRDQNEDGGWGWFSRMRSNPLTTGYALIGLTEVRDAGLPLDVDMAERAADYLRRQMTTQISLRLDKWEISRYAVALYALSQWEEDAASLQPYAAALFDRRASLSYSSRAFLLMALPQIDPESDTIDALVSEFTAAAVISASGTNWLESADYGWNWDSDTRTTALILAALTRVQPDHPLLPGAVRWLVMARQGSQWETTQETAWSVMALADWMQVSQELEGDFDYQVLLNDVVLQAGDVEANEPPVDETLTVPDEQLEPDNQLNIGRSGGEGSLYYTATLNLELPADEVGAFANGVFVERQYLPSSDNKNAAPITDPQLGDTVTVRLNVTLTNDMNYFVLEDWLPAGLEPVDAGLLTSGNASSPQLTCVNPGDPYWCYASWYFDHTELRDTGLHLYAEYLPRGAYVFSYEARVVMAGDFQVIPAQAFAFYQPEIYGRSAGMVMHISE